MPLVFFLFFFSGAAGLAYQVLWIRQLSFVFGVTAYAAGTVLAAFMAGLALGSWLAGPVLARIKRPLSAFGAVELLIGASALATPAALDLASMLYRALYDAAPESFLVQTLARFACAFIVLLVPTGLMGMTLPLLSASPAVRTGRFASHVSTLYAVNTSGAVAGALATGFVLIGSIGVSRTFLVAAACNALAGLGALLLDRVGQPTAEPAAPQSTGASSPRGPIAVWWVMAASGFASLALEIVWFRLMIQALDGTTYAVTVTLASVLIGIAVGGAIGATAAGARRGLARLVDHAPGDHGVCGPARRRHPHLGKPARASAIARGAPRRRTRPPAVTADGNLVSDAPPAWRAGRRRRRSPRAPRGPLLQRQPPRRDCRVDCRRLA